jgi:hypothetical protein
MSPRTVLNSIFQARNRRNSNEVRGTHCAGERAYLCVVVVVGGVVEVVVEVEPGLVVVVVGTVS